jgi:hypothetical protein
MKTVSDLTYRPTVTADSACRKSERPAPPPSLALAGVDLLFLELFRTVPLDLCVYVSRRTGAVQSAASTIVVLRGFVNFYPSSVKGQHYVVYLFFTTGGGGSHSLTLITKAQKRPRMGI